MPKLTIGDTTVEVGEEFLSLSPEEQQATVDEIAGQLKIGGSSSGSMPEPEPAPEPELTPGRVAGLTSRAAVQAAPGAVAGLPALAYDGTVGVLWNMGTQLVNLKRRLLGEEEAPYRDPFATTKAVTRLGELAADTLELPKPETSEERIAVGAGQTALEALGGARLAARLGQAATDAAPVVQRTLAELAEAPKTQAAIGALAGGGGQAAEESDVNPLIGTALGLGAGLTAVAAGQGARQAYDKARTFTNRTLARGDDVQRQLAAERVRSAASDPEAALRELEEGAGGELVPGSKPTTFQATGDVGLGALERDLQTANPEVFAQRRGQQNAARQEALRSVQGEGNAQEMIDFLRRELDEIDRVTAADEASARSSAEEAAEAFRPTDEAEGLGNRVRSSMRDAEEAARKRESALWDAVDPDGTLEASTQGAKQVVSEIYGKMTKAGRLGITPEERSVIELIQNYKPFEAFSELKDLSSQIKAAMRSELTSKGRTPAYARLVQLNQAVRSGMENTAAEIIAVDPNVSNRFQALLNEWQPSPGPGSGASVGESQARPVRSSGVSAVAREEAAQNRGAGSAARSQNVSGRKRQGKALSLTEFIAKNGGLPLDAETTARDWGNVSVGRLGKLARPLGRSIDGYWRNKLIEAGYLPPDPDGYASRDITKELFDAIENERAGRKTYSAADQMREPAAPELDGLEAELFEASKLIREELESVGVRPDEISTRAMNEAADLLARGEETDALSAYERAVMSLDEEEFIQPAASATKATDAPRESTQTRNIFDTFREDPEVGARYRRATEATRERVATYNKGYVGQILRREGDKESFRMGDASVAANLFRSGATGGERIKAAIRAGANAGDLSEIAALSLRKAALRPDGTIDPKRFQTWRSAHAEALKELPEDVRARFATASLASQALDRAAALRKARLDEFNKSVLGKVANVDPADLPKTIGSILNGQDATKRMAQLARAASKSPDAKEGLRRAVAEYIHSRFISNKEVAASGENAIRADAFASFVREKAPALKLALGDQVLRLQAIADDIRRAERSLQAIKIPGNSNTPQDIGAALDKHAAKAGSGSLLTQILVAGAAGLSVSSVKGAVLGVGGALGKNLLASMRAAGLRRVDELVLEIMLDPALAKAALRPSSGPDKGVQVTMAQHLSRRTPWAAVGRDVGNRQEAGTR